MEIVFVATPRWGNLCFGEEAIRFDGCREAAEMYASRIQGRVVEIEEARFGLVNLGIMVSRNTLAKNGGGAKAWYIFRSNEEAQDWASGNLRYPGQTGLEIGEFEKEASSSPQTRGGWSIQLNTRMNGRMGGGDEKGRGNPHSQGLEVWPSQAMGKVLNMRGN